MIRYKKIRTEDNWIVYSYEPDDSGDVGEIAINIVTGNTKVLKRYKDVKVDIYCGLVFSRLRSFHESGNYEESGYIAWC